MSKTERDREREGEKDGEFRRESERQGEGDRSMSKFTGNKAITLEVVNFRNVVPK